MKFIYIYIHDHISVVRNMDYKYVIRKKIMFVECLGKVLRGLIYVAFEI